MFKYTLELANKITNIPNSHSHGKDIRSKKNSSEPKKILKGNDFPRTMRRGYDYFTKSVFVWLPSCGPPTLKLTTQLYFFCKEVMFINRNNLTSIHWRWSNEMNIGKKKTDMSWDLGTKSIMGGVGKGILTPKTFFTIIFFWNVFISIFLWS